jgi:acetyl esterase/lipase
MAWPLRLIDDAGRLVPIPKNVTITPVHTPNRHAELIRSDKGLRPSERAGGRWSDRRAVLYLHGGAFVACGLNSHRPVAVRLSQAAGAVVLNLAYRMLPQNPISAAVDDAVEAYEWLLANGYEDIVIAGDSAGGYLAFMTTDAIKQRGLPRPAGIVAMSPLTDLDPIHKARHRNVKRCSLFTLEAVQAFTDHLRRTHETFETDAAPLVSPVNLDLSAMPPVQIHAASGELLLQDSELMTERLIAAGRKCELHVWEGQLHAFPAAAFVTRAGLEAIAKMGRFIREVTPAELPAAA